MALGDGIRRDIASVTSQERDRFRDALLELNNRFFPGTRDDFPAGHVSWWFKQDEIHQATHVHGGPSFLPWHRELCNRFEALLRGVDPDLSLHYWDWNSDPDPLFTDDFMGSASGDAGEPLLGAGFYDPTPEDDNFRDNSVHDLVQPTPNPSTWSYEEHGNPADPPESLTRDKAAGAPPVDQEVGGVFWPTDSDMVNAANFQEFNDLMQGIEMGTSNNGAHAGAHGYIGGNITDPHISFRDPFVFLLHANVDRLWAMWQTQPGHPERLDPDEVYGSDDGDPSITGPLQPWAGTSDWPVRPWFTPENQQVVKDCKHPSVVHPPCYDTLPTYPPAVTLQTPTITFNDVPEGETTVRAAVFSLAACSDVHFEITDGPTVLTGPPATTFGTPLGTTDTVAPFSDPAKAQAHLWVSFTGTTAGDMATGTVTIHCLETGEDFEIPITAETIPRPTVAVVLALDKSNSMNFESGIASLPKRIDVLKFSAPPFVDVIQEGNALGIVSFDHDAHDVMPVTGPLGPPPANPFDDDDRSTAKKHIALHTHNPEGNTSIGDAVERAHSHLEPEMDNYDHRAIIVFTDGHETAGKYIADVSDLIDDRVFAIALGTAQEVQPDALTALCNDRQGFLLLTGLLGKDDDFRLTKFYLEVLAGVTNEEIVRDPEGWLGFGQRHEIPFVLNEADIDAAVILLTPFPQVVKFILRTPEGQEIDPAVAGGVPGMRFSIGTNVAHYRLTLPAVLNSVESQAGTWHAVLEIGRRPGTSAAALERVRATNLGGNVHGLRYSVNVHSYSNLRMSTRLSQNSMEPGAILTLRARLTEYGLPVEQRALVRTELVQPDASQSVRGLVEVEPGVFETTVLASMPGVYRFQTRAEGTTFRGRPFTRERTSTGAVWRGGDAPFPSEKDDPRSRDEQLCRLLECLLVEKSVRRYLEKQKIDGRALARCLRRFCLERVRRPLKAGTSSRADELAALLKELKER